MSVILSQSRPKIAIVHDFAYHMGGAERCVQAFTEIFPEADLFMMFGNNKSLSEGFKNRKISYSFMNKIPGIRKYYRWTYPFWPIAMETLDLSDYDLVISQSSVAAKGIVTGVDTLHICYMNASMRYAWDLKDTYFSADKIGLKRFITWPLLTYLRIWDVLANKRPDILITGSQFQKQRVYKYFKRKVDGVINPPVQLPERLSEEELREYKQKKYYSWKYKDYYIAIAPFKPNKGGEFMIKCTKELGFKLLLIGGNKKDLKKYIKLADKANKIHFVGWVDEEEKWKLLRGAKGMLFFGVEDFGIAPVEAMGVGTPIVALKEGGALETVVEGKTGVFFEERTVDAVKYAMQRCDQVKWNRYEMREWAEKFSKERFKNQFADLAKNAYNDFVDNGKCIGW